MLWGIVAVALLATAFVLGSFVNSPWEGAIDNSAAKLTTTAQVVERDFAVDVAPVNGEITLGTELAVPAPSGLARSVVTQAAPKKGEMIDAGQLIVEISGQSIFALALEIPLYRDLVPGMEGPDVSSLQHALADVGLYHGAIDGDYGDGTATAVKELYLHNGKVPPESVPFEGTEAEQVVESENPDAEPATNDGKSEASMRLSEPANSPQPKEVPTGTPLSMGAVVDIPAEGSVVVLSESVGAELGEGAPAAVLLSRAASAAARVGVADAEQFKVGTEVVVSIPGSGLTDIKAVVSRASEFMPADDDARPGYDVTVNLDSSAVKGVQSGATATVVPRASAEPKRALAVPLSAVREDASGPYVLVRERGETPGPDLGTRVDLTLGMQTDGYVEVLGSKSGAFVAGTDVVIGGYE